MSTKIDHIVRQLIAEHEGGEAFFDALDNEIREDKDFCLQLYSLFINDENFSQEKTLIVGTGKFAKVFGEWAESRGQRFNYISLQGNLRELFNTNVFFELKTKIVNFPNVENAIIIDDSFFSGKTIQSISIALQAVNVKPLGAYVVYDGSKDTYKNLKSLFRYYK